MNNFFNKIKILVNKLKNEKEDVVITGDNSSGKSQLIKSYIEENLKDGIYYIDSMNRNFDNIYINRNSNPISSEDIVKRRISNEMYNKGDSFLLSQIEMYYENVESDLLKLLKKFIGVDFKLSPQDITINEEKYENLSNGYKAIIRIFLELLYVEYYCPEIKIIIIDEINEFLSPRNEGNFFPFIKKIFNKYRFIITTHSEETISTVKEGKLYFLKDNGYEIYNLNNFLSSADVRFYFENLYNMEKNEDDKLDDILRELLNKKIDDLWTDKEETLIKSLELKKLTNAQKSILKDIREW